VALADAGAGGAVVTAEQAKAELAATGFRRIEAGAASGCVLVHGVTEECNATVCIGRGLPVWSLAVLADDGATIAGATGATLAEAVAALKVDASRRRRQAATIERVVQGIGARMPSPSAS